ncbi:MAG: hypothetical protein ACRDOI_37000 [Trebonia sp.]
MGGNFLNASLSDFRFLGIKLPDRPARCLRIEVATRGRSPGARRDICRASFSRRGSSVGGILLVSSFNDGAVSHAPFYAHGWVYGGRAFLIVVSRPDVMGHFGVVGRVGQVQPIDPHASPT